MKPNFLPESHNVISQTSSTSGPIYMLSKWKQSATFRWSARWLTADCTTLDLGERELGSCGRQTGRYWSLPSGGQKAESTARQNMNLKKSHKIKPLICSSKQPNCTRPDSDDGTPIYSKALAASPNHCHSVIVSNGNPNQGQQVCWGVIRENAKSFLSILWYH